MPLFAMGILLNEIKMERGNWKLNAAGILFSAMVFHLIDVRGHNPAATVTLFGLLGFSAYGKVPLLRIKPLVFVGTISYSLYLFHNNLGTLLLHQLESMGIAPFVCFLLTTALVILLSSIVTFYFERPASKALFAWWSKRKNNSSFANGEPDSRLSKATS